MRMIKGQGILLFLKNYYANYSFLGYYFFKTIQKFKKYLVATKYFLNSILLKKKKPVKERENI